MTAALDLYWIPLGAGGRVVRLTGLVYEAVLAGLQQRPRQDLFHAALVAHLPAGRITVEVGPVWDRVGHSPDHGAVVTGPVGLRWLGRWRWFRYEVRRWRDGVILDLDHAVESPRRLTTDEAVVRRALATVGDVPPLTWGRDELDLGEMWNSNSVVAWILTCSGLDATDLRPPSGGRAPGFGAGAAAATGRAGDARVDRSRLRSAYGR